MSTEKKELQIVETDALTGLKNKNGMLYVIESDIFRLKHKNATGGTKQVALLLVDIDRLSRINREFGRVEGDGLIIKMKEVLLKSGLKHL